MPTCPSCRQENPHGFRFCGACATPLAEAAPAPREERKRVSVLFCDLVGFTGRAEAMDPEEVRALLQPYHARVRQELERHGGTVEKFIGDAVVALFGAPVAHEDDPERAVRAALAIRDAVTGDDLHVRLGVTTGEVLVALDARPESGEGMASGDVVNTAARLQAAAPVDSVLTDTSTHRATERAIAYRQHPPVEAKGKAEPVPVWEAVQARSRLGLDVAERTQTPLVGRRLEVDVLRTALARARGEQRPQLVTLVGVPGIGKSRLVLELFRHADAERELIRWRQGRSLPYGAGVTLWALGEIVKAETGVLETDSAEEAQEKLSASVRDAVGDDADWVERHLRPLVGLEGGGELSGDRRDEAFAAWRRYFEGVAERSPLVVVFEDLQWADDTLLDFIDHLVDWTTDAPMLLVATARPELLNRRPGWSGGKANAVIQSLAPLSDDETAALAHAILGKEVLPVEVRRSLVANAGGNPLYAEEFARMVTERRNGQVEPAVPDSVQGIIAARLDSLDPAEKALLQDAAVLGKVFWLAALEALTGEERSRLERRLHELERRELVRRDRQSAVAGQRQYAFRHLLIREVAYGQIPRLRRADRHAAAARWIEGLSPDRSDDRADMLAHHWSMALDYARSAGQDTRDLGERARAALVDAGDRALTLNAPASAASFFERALALARTDDVLLRYARSLYLTGDQRAEALLLEARDAFARSGDRAGEAFAEAMLSHIAWLMADAEASTRMVERAVDLMRPLPASQTKAYVVARAASRAHVAGRLEEAVALGREALALAEELGIDELRVHALTTIGDSRAGLGDRGGVADLERAVELGVSVNSPEAGRAMHNLGVRAFLDGDIARLHELLADGLRIDERFGNEAMTRFSRATTVGTGYFIGNWDEAVRTADAFIAECETSPHYQEAFVRGFRAVIRLARDDIDGARADVERTFTLVARHTDPQGRVAPLGLLARILLELEDPRATDTALEVLSLRIDLGPDPVSPILLTTLDLPTEIEERVRDVLRQAGVRTPWVDGARAALERRFVDAAEIYGRMPFRPAEADARLRAAQQLVAEGRRAEAAEQLERAITFWRSVGASRYIGLGERLLSTTA